jgi:hypothetical protein
MVDPKARKVFNEMCRIPAGQVSIEKRLLLPCGCLARAHTIRATYVDFVVLRASSECSREHQDDDGTTLGLEEMVTPRYRS